jgi:tRNA modification GTPase
VINDNKTIVALATPSGSGALGIIRLSGGDALTIANSLFIGKDLIKAKSHTVHFGKLKDKSVVVDECVATLFKAPTSYTKEDIVEFTCHGSSYILEKVIRLCIEQGARLAEPGEFTLRAFLNGAMDLTQAEAVADLIASNSQASHQLALRQMRGEFSSEISTLRQKLMDFASLIELELDFGEEDVEFANKDELQALVEHISKVIRSLIQSFELGNVLKNGVPVVISGKPNVGKSTLLNLLLKDDRAIVSDIPGTTRDTVEDEIIIEGIRFRFIDTAGIRETTDKIEAIGVGKTFEKMKSSAIIIHLFDPRETNEQELAEIQKGFLKVLDGQKSHMIPVANKFDVVEVRDKLKAFKEPTLSISAKEHEGIIELTSTLLKSANLSNQNSEETIVTNARHVEALTKTLEHLSNVLTGIDEGITNDFLSADIRQSLYYLGLISGEVTTEDLLGNIFSNFCIGK